MKTPTTKYNIGGRKPKKSPSLKYAITVEWLEMVFTGIIPGLSEVKEKLQISTNLYLLRVYGKMHTAFNGKFSVVYEGKDCGVFYYGFNGEYNYKNPDISAHWHVENSMLYEKCFTKKIVKIISELNIKLNHYFRLDIAIDGPNFIKDLNEIRFKKGYVPYRNVNSTGGFIWKTDVKENFILGSKRTENQVSIYPKSKYNDKPYIFEFWKLNDLPVDTEEINRLELRMKAKSVARLNKIKISDLDRPNYLATIFKSKVEKWLKFYKGPNKEEQFSLVDWSVFKEVKMKKKSLITPSRNLNRVKEAIKILTEEFYAENQGGELIDGIKIILDYYNLTDWYINKIKTEWKSRLTLKTSATVASWYRDIAARDKKAARKKKSK